MSAASTPALFNRQMTINFASAGVPHPGLRRALGPEGEGNVVNIIDQRAWRTAPTYFSYQMSKSALWAATRTLAQALAPRIRVNAIAPGPVLQNVRQHAEHFAAADQPPAARPRAGSCGIRPDRPLPG